MKKFLIAVAAVLGAGGAQAQDLELRISEVAELVESVQETELKTLLSVYVPPAASSMKFVFGEGFETTEDFINTKEKQVRWFQLLSNFVGTTGRDVNSQALGISGLKNINMIRTDYLSCEKANYDGAYSCYFSFVVDLWNNPSYRGVWKFWAGKVFFQVDFDENKKVIRIKQPEIG